MAAKTLSKRSSAKKSAVTYGRELQRLVADQRALTARMVTLLEEMEDQQDHLRIREAKKRNGNKPLVPWSEAKKRLGI